ncbi:related to Arginine metabolism regulation protein II [Zygosaccharomyces bailii ISA1307]|nr:related to Arginine metabolism regulation protein II [Zygosaccharomyces bailii ISA1307]
MDELKRVRSVPDAEGTSSSPDVNANKGFKRSKRGKTFTGCWTCRLRKVKCDLRRPHCQRCEKSSLACGGYDIKLRWSKPIRFDEYGVPLPATQNYLGDGKDEPQYQRRNIDFVKYKEEYLYYEDMDDELSALHNPPPEEIAHNRTWVIKKFGVFRGIENILRPYERPKRRKKKLHQIEEGINLNPIDTISTGPFLRDTFETGCSLFNNHEWISKELRDDALLSASALQGFPIVDFQAYNNPAPLDEGIAGGTATNDAHYSESNTSENSRNTEDSTVTQALRLLFHRHPQLDNQNVHDPPPNKVNLESIVPLGNKINIDCTGVGSKMPSTVMDVVYSPLPDAKIFNVPGSNNPLLQLPVTGLQVHGLTRFLLNYYYQNVADLMTVVALNSNPWKTLYFPRALRAVGDLAGIGYTSNSRNSLLNALLAVSCFNLQSKFARNSVEMQFFLNLGIEFRKQASGFLKICLSNTVKNERYKDVLTAILSMNSIDVVWGTMADCQQHLTICENFVKKRMKARPRISEKAKTLHRIFSFLKLIQDSTALDQVTEQEIVIMETSTQTEEDYENKGMNQCILDNTNVKSNIGDCWKEGLFREFVNKADGKIQIEFIKDGSVPQNNIINSPIFTNIASQSYSYSGANGIEEDIMSTDALYGLPQSLILLFSDCIRLVRHNEYYKIKNIAIPKEFTHLCLGFEMRLLKWTSEWSFYKEGTQEFVNDTIEGVYHHTLSFYYGLIIYFFTMARSLNHSFLQSHVEKVLVHLKALDNLIASKKVKIVPLIWQGFIAGCASTEVHVQEEFRKWASSLAASGMGSYWGARQVMFEVWRRKQNGEKGDSWYAVYRDWEMNLMLS